MILFGDFNSYAGSGRGRRWRALQAARRTRTALAPRAQKGRRGFGAPTLAVRTSHRDLQHWFAVCGYRWAFACWYGCVFVGARIRMPVRASAGSARYLCFANVVAAATWTGWFWWQRRLRRAAPARSALVQRAPREALPLARLATATHFHLAFLPIKRLYHISRVPPPFSSACLFA